MLVWDLDGLGPKIDANYLASGVNRNIVFDKSLTTTSDSLATDAENWFMNLPIPCTFFTMASVGGQIQLWFGYRSGARYGSCWKMVYTGAQLYHVFDCTQSRGFVFF